MNDSETLSAIKTVFTERKEGFLQRKHEQNWSRSLEPALKICFLFEQITTNHTFLFTSGSSEREITASDSVTKCFGFVETRVVIRLKRQKVKSWNGENKRYYSPATFT